MRNRWRIGKHYGIHVYEGDQPVATFHSPKDAARAVASVNAADVANAERDVWLDWLVRNQYGFDWWNGDQHPPVRIREYAERYFEVRGDPEHETVEDYISALAHECGWTDDQDEQ